MVFGRNFASLFSKYLSFNWFDLSDRRSFDLIDLILQYHRNLVVVIFQDYVCDSSRDLVPHVQF